MVLSSNMFSIDDFLLGKCDIPHDCKLVSLEDIDAEYGTSNSIIRKDEENTKQDGIKLYPNNESGANKDKTYNLQARNDSAPEPKKYNEKIRHIQVKQVFNSKAIGSTSESIVAIKGKDDSQSIPNSNFIKSERSAIKDKNNIMNVSKNSSISSVISNEDFIDFYSEYCETEEGFKSASKMKGKSDSGSLPDRNKSIPDLTKCNQIIKNPFVCIDRLEDNAECLFNNNAIRSRRLSSIVDPNKIKKHGRSCSINSQINMESLASKNTCKLIDNSLSNHYKESELNINKYNDINEPIKEKVNWESIPYSVPIRTKRLASVVANNKIKTLSNHNYKEFGLDINEPIKEKVNCESIPHSIPIRTKRLASIVANNNIKKHSIDYLNFCRSIPNISFYKSKRSAASRTKKRKENSDKNYSTSSETDENDFIENSSYSHNVPIRTKRLASVVANNKIKTLSNHNYKKSELDINEPIKEKVNFESIPHSIPIRTQRLASIVANNKIKKHSTDYLNFCRSNSKMLNSFYKSKRSAASRTKNRKKNSDKNYSTSRETDENNFIENSSRCSEMDEYFPPTRKSKDSYTPKYKTKTLKYMKQKKEIMENAIIQTDVEDSYFKETKRDFNMSELLDCLNSDDESAIKFNTPKVKHPVLKITPRAKLLQKWTEANRIKSPSVFQKIDNSKQNQSALHVCFNRDNKKKKKESPIRLQPDSNYYEVIKILELPELKTNTSLNTSAEDYFE